MDNNFNSNSNNSDNIKKEKNKKNVWRTIALILFAILIILLFFLLGRCSCEQQPDVDINIGGVPELDPNQGDYTKPDDVPAVAGGVAVPGWGSLTIPPNTTENIVVDFFNPEANADKYYLTFEIRLPNDSEQGYEVLYKSGLIEPGKHIQSITLNRGLDVGEYDAIIHVQPYRIGNKAPTNNADLKLKLIVK